MRTRGPAHAAPIRVYVSVHSFKDGRFVHLLVWIPQEKDPEAREVIY